MIQNDQLIRIVRNIKEDSGMERVSRREFGATMTAVAVTEALQSVGADRIVSGEANVSRHLTVAGRVNLGSYYTPAKYVEKVAGWLLRHGVTENWTIADLSCGYGAFFEMASLPGLSGCRYVGNDIDHAAIKRAQEMFPKVHFSERNVLFDIRRSVFGIGDDARLAIVGNPPYNDVTSQSKQDVKTDELSMDDDVRTRDLGLSSLLAYNKIEADIVAVLHPLSYLVKKANFNAAKEFFNNYQLVEHFVFSSQEFAGTSKTVGFPVVVALYLRAEKCGLTYDQVRGIRFETVEGDKFSLSGFDYVTDHIEKYPHKNRYTPELLFYTMRDINALKRSRTFIKDRITNAVDINPEKLAYYCYIDCFKRYSDVPYWMGNFNVPFIEKDFEKVRGFVVADAKYHNPSVFGVQPKIADDEVDVIREYIKNSILK